jgi:hypothetical protein
VEILFGGAHRMPPEADEDEWRCSAGVIYCTTGTGGDRTCTVALACGIARRPYSHAAGTCELHIDAQAEEERGWWATLLRELGPDPSSVRPRVRSATDVSRASVCSSTLPGFDRAVLPQRACRRPRRARSILSVRGDRDLVSAKITFKDLVARYDYGAVTISSTSRSSLSTSFRRENARPGSSNAGPISVIIILKVVTVATPPRLCCLRAPHIAGGI